MKTFLIITGPQGSGNHLFSKLLALHPAVYGWKELLDTYWIAHQHEPFAECWDDPSLLDQFDWTTSDYYVSSVSCPYARSSGQTQIPDYRQFINRLRSLKIQVKLAIIGRDINILEYQQQRVRNTTSLPSFLDLIPVLDNYSPFFISQELVYLYKQVYLKSLSSQLDFPIAYDHPAVESILSVDANSKYLVPAPQQELDLLVKKVSGLLN